MNAKGYRIFTATCMRNIAWLTVSVLCMFDIRTAGVLNYIVPYT